MPFNSTILGTVIASVLQYDHLVKITGDPLVVDPKKSQWIPADNRSIAGSNLSKQTGLTEAPDLRGRFLRGLNTIYSNGQPPLVLDTADVDDPDKPRKAGDYQGDTLKKHTHPFSHIIQVGPNEPHNVNGGFSHNAGGSEGYNNYSSIEADPNDGKETRPKNIAVYYYIKIN